MNQDELAYYIKNNVLSVIHKNLVFVELVNQIYRLEKNGIYVDVSVRYIKQKTKVIEVSQYSLVLKKQDTWFIVK